MKSTKNDKKQRTDTGTWDYTMTFKPVESFNLCLSCYGVYEVMLNVIIYHVILIQWYSSKYEQKPGNSELT